MNTAKNKLKIILTHPEVKNSLLHISKKDFSYPLRLIIWFHTKKLYKEVSLLLKIWSKK